MDKITGRNRCGPRLTLEGDWEMDLTSKLALFGAMGCTEDVKIKTVTPEHVKRLTILQRRIQKPDTWWSEWKVRQPAGPECTSGWFGVISDE